MNMIDFFNFRRDRISLPPVSRTEVGGERSAVVALGGGGARGLAHLGVMQSVLESGMKLDRIVGVSMGSLIGAMCAVQPNSQVVQGNALALLQSPKFKGRLEQVFGTASSLSNPKSSGYFAWYGRLMRLIYMKRKKRTELEGLSLMSENILNEAIDFLLPDIKLEDVPTPLSIVAVDLVSGHRVVLETGSLRKAVRASTAIAGFFPPVEWDDMLLCDIGTVDSIPVTIARSYAKDLTIGVDVGQERTRVEKCKSAFEVLVRMQEIGEQMLRRYVAEESDIIVRPEVGNISWFDFSRPEQLIEAGRVAGRVAISSLSRTHS